MPATVEIDQNSAVAQGRDQIKKLQLQRKALEQQKKVMEQELEAGDPELLRLRAAQFGAGGDSEKYDKLRLRLTSVRDRLTGLDFDLRALKEAEGDAWEELRDAESQTKDQYREKKYREAEHIVTELKAKLDEAVKLNGRLLVLEEELKQANVSHGGSKSFVMLCRYGIAWNALSPFPIKGSAIHISAWYAYMKQIFGE